MKETANNITFFIMYFPFKPEFILILTYFSYIRLNFIQNQNRIMKQIIFFSECFTNRNSSDIYLYLAEII
ncbi:hypothetical protein CVD28_14190 [Bacillus sp. M6-12]|nr:hypothetical protein CVD28_14190 [Bacillus sp. M6-12]